ncbi:YkgJ family cysteine cluster protein [Halosimplex amylolyticum]|uniref:YkgJ family cysteine cluster protein n=1 Tax=Halosimplex amylolyticum TaxID=3396616 RepID=UPI003F56292F
MEVHCEGCAGCCLDWRALAPAEFDHGHERRGRYRPLDDIDNLVPLSCDEVRAFLGAGHAAALVARLFRIDDGPSVSVGGVDVAAVRGRPAFLVGLAKVPKPVAPFDSDPHWLPTCVFLDPQTLQCRIHGAETYPETCATYPGDNLALDAETECERVERAHGGDRLVDDDPPADSEPAIGPGAVGSRVFVHPAPDRIEDAVERLAAGDATRADHAEFVAVAAASSPGTLAVNDDRYERARERARGADSWVDDAIAEWFERAEADESPDPEAAATVEDERGAPGTPGWE